MSYRIRLIKPEDRPAWEPLWRAYLAFYKTELPDSTFDATFARYSDPDTFDMRGWIAWQGDTALGLVHAIAHPHGWRPEPVTYLQDLFTAPEARGQGVATALIETVYADADAAGRPAVYWLTQTGNETARALYDKIALPTDFMVYRRNTG
ncbi:GNAT family N-acetyltransferase [Nioella nitratireducens]|uniref:GNAT family N-acetyltransferase n=1 Tax=Nioella nitratireducens TaxID=1287720 RepID=UPI0008FD1B5F|nr:GNAT family N-acetyltransferase [Nioella nitratireducens]